MSVLIIGGSSGLGLALAKEFVDRKEKTLVTGRKKPNVDFVEFKKLELSQKNLPALIENFVEALPKIKTLVYAAGFYQDGTVTDLSEGQIEAMLDVGGRGLIYITRAILNKQGS